MNTRNRTLSIGLFALMVCGSALAHDPRPYAAYPDSNLSVSATVWGSSGGYSGWSGNLSFGNNYVYAPGYIMVAAPILPVHRHGPSCRHVPHHAYYRTERKSYKHGHSRGSRRGYGNHDRR